LIRFCTETTPAVARQLDRDDEIKEAEDFEFASPSHEDDCMLGELTAKNLRRYLSQSWERLKPQKE
jgi:hypothetical protein